METDGRILSVERSTSTAHRLTHYDGACGNIHGHNMKWSVDVVLDDMTEVDESNMPLDLKDISGVIDEADHACLLSEEDPLADILSQGTIEQYFGDVIWYDSDPTCELVAEWMAKNIYGLSDHIGYVQVEVSETDKYSIEASWDASDTLSPAP